jgi:hypothetical protein
MSQSILQGYAIIPVEAKHMFQQIHVGKPFVIFVFASALEVLAQH